MGGLTAATGPAGAAVGAGGDLIAERSRSVANESGVGGETRVDWGREMEKHGVSDGVLLQGGVENRSMSRPLPYVAGSHHPSRAD
jgi:hypothetical protein